MFARQTIQPDSLAITVFFQEPLMPLAAIAHITAAFLPLQPTVSRFSPVIQWIIWKRFFCVKGKGHQSTGFFSLNYL